jgi:hypothetical protein
MATLAQDISLGLLAVDPHAVQPLAIVALTGLGGGVYLPLTLPVRQVLVLVSSPPLGTHDQMFAFVDLCWFCLLFVCVVSAELTVFSLIYFFV